MAGTMVALGRPPTEKLTRENFIIGKAYIIPSLHGANVMGLLDGSDVAPPKTSKFEDINKLKTVVTSSTYTYWVFTINRF
jgi:hypothetical protein